MQVSWNTAKLHSPEAQTLINENFSGSGQPNNKTVKKSTTCMIQACYKEQTVTVIFIRMMGH